MNRNLRRILIPIACLLACHSGLSATSETIAIDGIQIIERTDVRFPGTMRVIGVKEGDVSLVLAVDSQGKLQDTFILESSRKAFAKSAIKSIKEWKFVPATYDGTPIDSSIRIDLNFQIDKKLTWQTFQAPGPADITRTGTQESPVKVASFNELDSIPLPIEMSDPQFAADGNATIEFYIDEMGKVRCPRITRGSSLNFGRTLIASVSTWRFEPPVADGNRTNTIVRQSFTFADGELTAGLEI